MASSVDTGRIQIAYVGSYGIAVYPEHDSLSDQALAEAVKTLNGAISLVGVRLEKKPIRIWIEFSDGSWLTVGRRDDGVVGVFAEPSRPGILASRAPPR